MNSRTVYLIDDDQEMLELLSDVVAEVGLNPQSYSHARHLFEQVLQFETGAVLVLDLSMPEMDGVEVMRQLAQRTNPPALILISGRVPGILRAAEKLGRAQQLKILASLSKPLEIVRLQQLLIQHLPTAGADKQKSLTPVDRSELTAEALHQAICQEQLVLHYQPQIEIATNSLMGVEALVRWRHPRLGLIFPDQFIPIAEQGAILDELTVWVINRAIGQLQQWHCAGLLLNLSINISAGNITSLEFPEQLSALLISSQLDPACVTLEVTETALMSKPVTSLDILTRLRLKGIGLSIDDFGTGYSSLSQLHRVPFTELKIDLSFVIAMAQDAEARAIVKTCIMLGHELEMRVVAEGVEDQRSLDLLLGLGCDIAQGYFIARPMPGEVMTCWASTWSDRGLG